MQTTPATVTQQQRRQLKAENKTWPVALKQIPKAEWPAVIPSAGDQGGLAVARFSRAGL